jgi:hypothetical protein
MQIPAPIAAVAPDGQLAPRQRRHFLIELCRRRIRPGTGSAPEFLRRRTAMNPWPDLRGVLKDIPWVIVGGVATRAYMPERATKAMDVLIRREDEQVALSCLRKAGYEVVSPLSARFRGPRIAHLPRQTRTRPRLTPFSPPSAREKGRGRLNQSAEIHPLHCATGLPTVGVQRLERWGRP